MKKIVFALILTTSLTLIGTSCSLKSGCPAETAQVKTDKNGNFKVGKTKSQLFPKKAKKRKRKG